LLTKLKLEVEYQNQNIESLIERMCDLKATQPVEFSSSLTLDTLHNDNDNDNKIWSRLLPLTNVFKPCNLTKESTTFGRHSDCDISLEGLSTQICSSSAYSNNHFTIKRVLFFKLIILLYFHLFRHKIRFFFSNFQF
jgi:hypothetical protein